jgi:Ca2+/H+ antiporter, TMEM165/GDT1 family
LEYAAVIGTAFALTFLAELPDKSMFAALVLGTRYRAIWVWAGSAAAFAVQMAIAVTVGQLLALLPHPVVNGVVAGIFVAAAAYLWWSSLRGSDQDASGADEARERAARGDGSFLRVAATAFVVVFLAEWGDITQFTAANLAARYNPALVFAGATLGVWAVSAIAVTVGATSLSVVPVTWVRRITAVIMLGLGVYTAVIAATG